MGFGYARYPDAILTEDDKWTLDHHRFFDPQPKRQKGNFCPFPDGRPMPVPRPHPIPVVRHDERTRSTTGNPNPAGL